MNILKLAAALVVALTFSAQAADKGGPDVSVKVNAAGEVVSRFTGCYAEGGASSVFVEGATKAFSVGAGCDISYSVITFGASARYTFAESSDNALALRVRAGYNFNPYLLGYGTLGIYSDGKSLNFSDSPIMAGLGLETYLAKNLTIFAEIEQDIAKRGDGNPPVYIVHGGLRFRF